MKLLYPIIMAMLCALYTNTAYAGIATDIKINPQAGERQLSVAITVAENNWYFAVYNYIDSASGNGGYKMLRSKDRGFTWTVLATRVVTGGRIPVVDIIAKGNNVTIFKVFVASVERSSAGIYTAKVQQYDAETGADEFTSLQRSNGTRQIYDIAIAGDDKDARAVGTFPFSLGCVYSAAGASNDSLFFCANGSSSGGLIGLTRNLVLTTTAFLRGVDVDYGADPTESGKYHFVWERLSDPNDAYGHIFLSRNTGFVTSGSYSPPICLDSINTSAINKCRNPTIAAFHNTFSINNTYPAMVLTEVSNGAGSDIKKFSILNASSGANWQFQGVVGLASNNEITPDLVYSKNDNLFVGLYFNATTSKVIPLVFDPDGSFNFSMLAVNNETGITNAMPKIAVDSLGGTIYAWTRQPNSAAGIAMFDAVFRGIESQLIRDSICNGQAYTFGGEQFTAAGTYRDTFQILRGDSVSIVDLVVNTPTSFTFTQGICPGDTFMFNGLPLSAAGTFSVTLPDRNGCDSVTSVTVSLLPAAEVPVVTASGNVLSTQAFSAYQWQLNGEDISGANSQTLTVFVSGNYTVRGTTANGCRATSQVFTHTISGINNLLLKNLRVYPNPATNVLHIDGDYNSAVISITDIVGQQVLQSNVGAHAALNVADLAAGTYIVNFSVDGKTASVKFNKQ